MTSPLPFAIWGINLIEQLLMGKGWAQYVVFVVDCFTKWIEAGALAIISVKKICDFTYFSIFYWYRIPHKIVSNNSTQFEFAKFQKLYDNLGIKKSFSSIAQPQPNG